MHETISVSVIIPVYNVAPYVEQCLNSVLNQTYDNIEIIVVDDCGTDDSMDIVERIKEEYKGNKIIRIIHHEHNRGLSAARNTGVKYSIGSYISFVDSDDFISTDMIEVLINEVDDKSIGIVSCLPLYGSNGNFKIFKNDWDIKKKIIVNPDRYAETLLLEKTCHTVWAKLYREDIVKNIPFREGRTNEDTLFNYDSCSYIENNSIYMKILPKYMYYYRYSENSICNKNGNNFLLTLYGNQVEILEEIRSSKKQLYYLYCNRFLDSICKHLNDLLWDWHQNKYIYNELSKKLSSVDTCFVLKNKQCSFALNFIGMRFFPNLYRYWREMYVIHTKPTVLGQVRILIGQILHS